MAAVEEGRSGERYLVAGRYHSLRDLVEALEKVTGIPAPRLTIPYPVMLLTPGSCSGLRAGRGRRPWSAWTG